MKALVIVSFLWLCPLLVHAIVTDGWDIHIDTPTITPKLVKEQEVQTYTGEMTLARSEHSPRKGYVYVLVPIQVKRVIKNETPFPIEQIQLKQGENIFNRIENDSFLVNYDILPFTHLAISLEKYKGTLLFEIPLQKEGTRPLSIVYKTKVIQTL